jgi:hypothetical protein
LIEHVSSAFTARHFSKNENAIGRRYSENENEDISLSDQNENQQLLNTSSPSTNFTTDSLVALRTNENNKPKSKKKSVSHLILF